MYYVFPILVYSAKQYLMIDEHDINRILLYVYLTELLLKRWPVKTRALFVKQHRNTDCFAREVLEWLKREKKGGERRERRGKKRLHNLIYLLLRFFFFLSATLESFERQKDIRTPHSSKYDLNGLVFKKI